MPFPHTQRHTRTPRHRISEVQHLHAHSPPPPIGLHARRYRLIVGMGNVVSDRTARARSTGRTDTHSRACTHPHIHPDTNTPHFRLNRPRSMKAIFFVYERARVHTPIHTYAHTHIGTCVSLVNGKKTNLCKATVPKTGPVKIEKR